MKQDRFKKIFIDRKVENSPLVSRITGKLSSLPVEVVDGPEHIRQEIRLASDSVGESKKLLFLTEQKSFLRPCPCTSRCVSCDYWNIDLQINCPLDCSYCILQVYLEEQPLIISVNRGNLIEEMELFFKQKRSRVIRIGTGELGDSLALDDLTGDAYFLVELFRKQHGYHLELKTKTGNINSLLRIRPEPNVVLAWSLNTERMVEAEERGAASLEERLQAAVRASAHGYKVAFHFDPIIHYPGWNQDYQQVVERIFEIVPAESIAWVSLGTLRFAPDLLKVVRRRFPQSAIFEHEFIRSRDGKIRYPRPLRIKLYQELRKMFSAFSAEEKLYLCMESIEVWNVFSEKNKRRRLSSAFPFPWLS